MTESCYSNYLTHVLVKNEARFPVLLASDHASAHIPLELNNLGVAEEHLCDHIAWDIGAGAVAREMGRLLSLPVVLGAQSRLVIDCNRNLDDPTAFPAVSDGVPVPGNADLDAAECEARANAFYWPYHHAVRDELRKLEAMAIAPALIAVDSFTPHIEGQPPRRWPVGALWDKDDRIAGPIIRHLNQLDGVVVGDNQPYSGRHPADFTLDHHAEAEGLPHLGIEIRQDLIGDDAGVEHWAGVLAAALQPILSDTGLYVHRAGQL
jgi:predicted N-formylglutamate amidohydrolase